MANAWEQVGNKCLNLARNLLEIEAAPTAATVEAVERLVSIAIAIDKLNLQWAEQNRYGEQVFRGRPSSRRATEN